jgi:hypothetical protein
VFQHQAIAYRAAVRKFHENVFKELHQQASQALFYPALAVRLFELQRNAVLITMQKAKVSLARQRHPTARDNRFGNPLANRLTLPYWKSKGEALSATRSRTAVITGRCAGLNSLVERLRVQNLPLHRLQ